MTAPLDWELSEPSEPLEARPLTPEEEAIAEWLARRDDEPPEVWRPDAPPERGTY